MLTLLIPIGGPGAGKTTLGQNLKEFDILAERGVALDKVFTTCRDELFAQCKKDHADWSQRKIRRYLFDKFVEFRESVEDWRLQNPQDSVVVYLDSVNAQRGGRKYLIEEFQPDRVILVNMRLPYEKLMERVGSREGHPTFPVLPKEQEIIIKKILGGLEFAGEEDLIWSHNRLNVFVVEM